MQRRVITIVLLLATIVCGQYYFGKNKIQPFDYRWEVFQTPHFDIYYFSSEDEIARLTGKIAEETYARYTAHFRYAPQERVPIVLYSSSELFSETHTTPFIIPEGVGGFTEFIKGRVILPYDGSLARFEHILPHELVHIWQLHYGEFLHDAHELFFIDMPPLWFTEGQAELLSEPNESPAERTEIIAALANDRFVLPQNFYAISGTYQMYKEGENFLRFLNEHYGENTDVRLFERVWEHAYFSETFSKIMGISLEDGGLLWRQWLRTRFGDYIARRTPQKVVGKNISPAGYFFSPVKIDSQTVLCKGNKLGYTGLYFLWRGNMKLLRKIEFTESAEATKLFGNRISAFGDSLVAYSAKARGEDRLFVVNIKTKRYEIPPWRNDSIVAINSPSFTSDGNGVLFAGADISGQTDIFRLDLQTEKSRRLTNDHFYDAEPIALPNGDILFVSDRNGPKKMGLFLRSGNSLFHLAADAPIFRPTSPSISKNGRYLAFIADDDTFPDTYIIDLDSDSLWQMTNISEPVVDVSFAGGEPRCENNGLSCCTLLVSISTNRGIAIKEIVPDSLEFIGIYPRKQVSEQPWQIPVSAPSLSAAEQKPKPNAHKLTFDLAQGNIATSSAQEMGGGLEIMLSDMMGDRRMYAFFLEIAQNWKDMLSDANIVVAYDKLGTRWRKTIGAYHLHLFPYNRYDGYYDERQAGILGGASYSFSRFSRVEGTAYAYYSNRNDIAKRGEDGILSANLSLIRDTSLWGITGPIDGMRANLTVGAGTGLSGQLYNYLVSLDLRDYLRLSRRSCWAHRIIARYSDGKEPKRFYMGGTWDFRGYPYFYFFGKNQLLFNSELRFPLFDRILVRMPLLDMDLRGLRGAIFFDAGDAWEEKPNFVGSFGTGLRMNLEGYAVIRFDMAQTTDFKTIDPHWKWDIFFGWDF